jgi:hypothetical protein
MSKEIYRCLFQTPLWSVFSFYYLSEIIHFSLPVSYFKRVQQRCHKLQALGTRDRGIGGIRKWVEEEEGKKAKKITL